MGAGHCFTPVLVILFGVLGLSAWVSGIDYVVFPIMFASMGLVAYSLYLRSGRKGPSPLAVIVIAVIAISALLYWLQFHYAFRITFAAAAAVAAYAFYLRSAKRKQTDIKETVS
jgi:mercuric ion transport protein